MSPVEAALPTFDEDDEFGHLRDAMRRVRPLALVGAGASAASGYPSWDGLLDLLDAELRRVAASGEVRLAPKLSRVVRRLTDPAWQAEEFRTLLGKTRFDAFLRTVFDKPAGGVREPHHAIARLGFRHVLTTNFEPCIELAMAAAGRPCHRVNWRKSAEVQAFFADLSDPVAETSVVYLHGRFDDPNGMVLTETDYARVYLREDARRRLLAVFMIQPVVFIGFSMNDPDLGQLLREVLASLRSTDGPKSVAGTVSQHFGIFGYHTSDERDVIRRRMRGKYGLRTVFYRLVRQPDGRGWSHENLMPLLRQLEPRAAAVGPEAAAHAPHPKPRRKVGWTGSNVRKAEMALDAIHDAESDDDTMDAEHRYPEISRPRPETGSDAGFFDLDPQKGQWGGRDVDTLKGRRVGVANVRDVIADVMLTFDLVVERQPGSPPLDGKVLAHLHPTFVPDLVALDVIGDHAVITINAIGAFTVGVEADEGATRLELDLAEVPSLPPWFRAR